MKKEAMKNALNKALDALGDGLAPLYDRVGNDLHPRPAYLRLNEDGEVGFWVNYSDGTPEPVWHGRDLLWSLNPRLTREALRALANDDRVASLLERVYAGLSSEWDGSNRVGRLSDDAEAASEELEALLEREYNECDSCLVKIADAGRWLWDAHTRSLDGLSSLWSPDVPLDEAVASLEADATSDGYLLDGDLEAELLEALEMVGDEDPDALTGEHRREYEARFASA